MPKHVCPFMSWTATSFRRFCCIGNITGEYQRSVKNKEFGVSIFGQVIVVLS